MERLKGAEIFSIEASDEMIIILARKDDDVLELRVSVGRDYDHAWLDTDVCSLGAEIERLMKQVDAMKARHSGLSI